MTMDSMREAFERVLGESDYDLDKDGITGEYTSGRTYRAFGEFCEYIVQAVLQSPEVKALVEAARKRLPDCAFEDDEIDRHLRVALEPFTGGNGGK